MILNHIFLPLLCVFISEALASPARECPAGYFYAGEDTPAGQGLIVGEPRSNVFYEEVARSDVYSCYKVVNSMTKDIGQVDYFDALKACSDEEKDVKNKARLVSFEDGFYEIQRFVSRFFDHSKPLNHKMITSGLKLPNFKEYVWTSSNDVYNISKAFIKIKNVDDPTLPCLALTFNTSYDFSLEAANCKDMNATAYVCEVRVQMVTFYMWFSTNSWNLILIFTIVILGIALCMSGFAYKSSPRVLRSRVVSAPAGVAQVTKAADLPPSYETYVDAQRVHEGLPPKYDSNGEQLSRIYQLKNKGEGYGAPDIDTEDFIPKATASALPIVGKVAHIPKARATVPSVVGTTADNFKAEAILPPISIQWRIFTRRGLWCPRYLYSGVFSQGEGYGAPDNRYGGRYFQGGDYGAPDIGTVAHIPKAGATVPPISIRRSLFPRRGLRCSQLSVKWQKFPRRGLRCPPLSVQRPILSRWRPMCSRYQYGGVFSQGEGYGSPDSQYGGVFSQGKG